MSSVSGPSAVRIALVSPDLLGTYGDKGNAEVLRQRLRWRGRSAEVVSVTGTVPTDCDIYVLGGGEDSAQVLAAERAARSRGLQGTVEQGAVVLAVCAGLQILGERFAGPDGREHPGLGLLDVTTTRRARRAVGEVVASPIPAELAGAVLTGFENHGGATRLGPAAQPLAHVVSGVGNGGEGTEGVTTGRIVGTYLHGPVLARNPALADLLLEWAVGEPLPPLEVPAVERLRARRLRARRLPWPARRAP